MKLKTLTYALAAAAIAIAGSAGATTIRVSQESASGAGDFDANVLGFIESYSTALSIAQFYQYNSPNAASYNGELNGGPTPISSATQSFFVSASDGLSLVTVHDNPNDGSGGNTRMTHVLTGGAGGSAGFTVEDDPSEGTTISDVAGNRVFDTVHNWIACCTDGFAIGDLGGSFEIFAQFDTSPTGITNWLATDADGTLALALAPQRRVRFDVVNPVPVPAAGLMLIAGIGALGALRRRRKDAS